MDNVIIDIEGIPEYAFGTGITLKEAVPIRYHYAICTYCGSLYFKKVEENEEAILLVEEANTCQNCATKYC